MLRYPALEALGLTFDTFNFIKMYGERVLVLITCRRFAQLTIEVTDAA